MSNVTLTPTSPKGLGLVVVLTDDAYRAGGDSTWNEIVRPRREAGVEYAGTASRVLVVPGVFDGIGKSVTVGTLDTSVEPDCLRLEQFARRTATTGEPPVLAVTGAAPHGSLRWVIDSLAWDEHPILRGNGSRCQQKFIVTLKEFAAVESIITEARGSKATTKARTVKVVRADFPQGLPRVASRKLGKSSRWPEIAAINKNRRGKVIRDPADIYVGQELRLP